MAENLLRTSEKVVLFHTCLINEFFPQAGLAVVKVLEKLGWNVSIPTDQTCCGQPAFNSGFVKEARKVAKKTIECLLETEGAILIPSGSCADMMVHQYPKLFVDDPKFKMQLDTVLRRCYEFSQFLEKCAPDFQPTPVQKQKIAYHPSCHLTRGLGVRNEPINLLKKIDGVELVNFEDQYECCGFGGTFAVKEPEISSRMMQNKLENIAAAGAEKIIGCDMSCLMHLSGGARRMGLNIKVQHIAELLLGDES